MNMEISKKKENINEQAKNKTQIQKLTISGMIIALYCVIMYFTQSFAFGAYQIRIATSMYALAYIYPFLVIPLGLANFVSNLLGGMGLVDMIGGCVVGIITSLLVVGVKKTKISSYFVIIPIILIPGCVVPIWLSGFTGVPYPALALNLCIGQAIPAVCGAFLIKILKKVL